MIKNKTFLLIFVLVLFIIAIAGRQVYGQGIEPNPTIPEQRDTFNEANQLPTSNAFTYQGELSDSGGPLNGNYNFAFSVFDGPDPVTATQIGTTDTISNVLLTDGLFTVLVDVGSNVFTGENRWLRIAITEDGMPFTPLLPAQQLTAAPYALYATNGPDAGSRQ